MAQRVESLEPRLPVTDGIAGAAIIGAAGASSSPVAALERVDLGYIAPVSIQESEELEADDGGAPAPVDLSTYSASTAEVLIDQPAYLIEISAADAETASAYTTSGSLSTDLMDG